jgi:hypothetical protein
MFEFLIRSSDGSQINLPIRITPNHSRSNLLAGLEIFSQQFERNIGSSYFLPLDNPNGQPEIRLTILKPRSLWPSDSENSLEISYGRD